MCTQATRDKFKTVPYFANIWRKKYFIELTVTIKGITLQFESNKDLSTTLMRSLARIVKYRKGPTKSPTKHGQQFTVATAIFFTYGCILAFRLSM